MGRRPNVIDMERELEVDAGVPVAAVVEGDDEALPAGRYVTVTHVGHPDRLVEAAHGLLEWAAQQDLRWDMSDTDRGQRWGCRLEVLKTDPREQPDWNKRETELVFRLAV